MKQGNLLLATGIAALAIGLIALPSHSTPAQDPAPAAPAAPEAELAPGAPDVESEFNWVTSVGDESGSWLGVETREVTASNVKELKLPGERGVVIGKVLDDGGVGQSGVRATQVLRYRRMQPGEAFDMEFVDHRLRQRSAPRDWSGRR